MRDLRKGVTVERGETVWTEGGIFRPIAAEVGRRKQSLTPIKSSSGGFSMKWFILLLVVAIGAGIYFYTKKPAGPQTGTPRGTASVYVEAAVNGDMGRIQSICVPEAAENAKNVAKELAAAGVTALKWQNTASDKPNAVALTSFVGGRLLTIELTQEGDQYKVSNVGLAQ